MPINCKLGPLALPRVWGGGGRRHGEDSMVDFFFFAVQIGTHRGGDASGGPSRLTGLTEWQI